MAEITEQRRQFFRQHGYLIIPEVLDADQLASSTAAVKEQLRQQPAPPSHRGIHFLWPQFGPTGHPLLDLYRSAGVATLANSLLRPDLPADDPAAAQIATTYPPWPNVPGGPHVDGITPPEPSGRPGTFSLLAGLWLTDQSEPDHGNLYVWPGTHLRFGAWLATHGPDALTQLAHTHPGPYPDVELGTPQQLTGPAAASLFAHYLLAHNIGGHLGTTPRLTIYYRLTAANHKANWRTAVTDPLREFA